MTESIWTWDILGMGDYTENIIQKFLWSSCKAICGNSVIYEYQGAEGGSFAIDMALSVGRTSIGDDWTEAREKVVRAHLQKIMEDGYPAWFDYIMKYRAGTSLPREFDLDKMELRDVQMDKMDRENLKKLGYVLPGENKDGA